MTACVLEAHVTCYIWITIYVQVTGWDNYWYIDTISFFSLSKYQVRRLCLFVQESHKRRKDAKETLPSRRPMEDRLLSSGASADVNGGLRETGWGRQVKAFGMAVKTDLRRGWKQLAYCPIVVNFKVFFWGCSLEVFTCFDPWPYGWIC